MTQDSNAHGNEFCFLHKCTSDPLWGIKELITWHNYLNARYFRNGRDLRSFVVSSKDKEREELVCLSAWARRHGSITMAPTDLFVCSEEFYVQGDLDTRCAQCIFSLRKCTWPRRVHGLWGPLDLVWIPHCHRLSEPQRCSNRTPCSRGSALQWDSLWEKPPVLGEVRVGIETWVLLIAPIVKLGPAEAAHFRRGAPLPPGRSKSWTASGTE